MIGKEKRVGGEWMEDEEKRARDGERERREIEKRAREDGGRGKDYV